MDDSDFFSYRYGHERPKLPQIGGMDRELRNKLWTCLLLTFFSGRIREDHMDTLKLRLCHKFFKIPIDEAPAHAIQFYHDQFFRFEWHRVYYFIEFVFREFDNGFDTERDRSEFSELVVRSLRDENAGYTLSNGKFVPITSDTEIKAIEEAEATPFEAVNAHVKRALELFSDRDNPDYRNSIKEAISAVESICRLIVHDQKATLGDALKRIDTQEKPIHPCQKKAFEVLYGYTSDEDGIRHAMNEIPAVDSVDAKWMSITCSAFVNYLIARAVELGIPLEDKK